MSQYYQKPHRGARGITNQKPPTLSERLCAKALVAAYRGKPWERYITFARVAARREEFEQRFEQAQRDRAKGARI